MKINNELIPRMKVVSKHDFEELKHKYKVTVSTTQRIIDNAKESDVLVLQVQFRNGFHWIDNIWILNENKMELFMELMFGKIDTPLTKSPKGDGK